MFEARMLPDGWETVVRRHQQRWKQALLAPRSMSGDRAARGKVEAALRVLARELGRPIPRITWRESLPELVETWQQPPPGLQKRSLVGRDDSLPTELTFIDAVRAPENLRRLAWQPICRLQALARLGLRLPRRTIKVLSALSKLARHSGGFALTATEAHVASRPLQLVSRDGLVHNLRGPALVWTDGKAMEVWHGYPTRTPRVVSAGEYLVLEWTGRAEPSFRIAPRRFGSWHYAALEYPRYGELYFRHESVQAWCRVRAAFARDWHQVETGIGITAPIPLAPDDLTDLFYGWLSASGQSPGISPGALRVIQRVARPPVRLPRGWRD